MPDITSEDMRKIAREEIGQHEQNSEKLLNSQLEAIHNQLTQIQKNQEAANKEDRDYDKRLTAVEGKVKALFAWKDSVENKPEKNLNRTSTIIGIIATIFSLLTSAAMIAVFKALTALGNKI